MNKRSNSSERFSSQYDSYLYIVSREVSIKRAVMFSLSEPHCRERGRPRPHCERSSRSFSRFWLICRRGRPRSQRWDEPTAARISGLQCSIYRPVRHTLARNGWERRGHWSEREVCILVRADAEVGSKVQAVTAGKIRQPVVARR
jgi:hypothetical protein